MSEIEQKAAHYLSLIEKYYHWWCEGEIDIKQHASLNGDVWKLVRQAGPEVEALVQKGVDATE